jgi:uracil-DNA glycosylase
VDVELVEAAHQFAALRYVGDGEKNAAVTPAQVELGRRHLIELLGLAPAVTVILALGKPARASLTPAAAALNARGVRVIHAPHPSPLQAGSRGDSHCVKPPAGVVRRG